jgi:3-hydroxyisobutyrate dehydrogenase-like beta-hydroxyacid dehydrogenase
MNIRTVGMVGLGQMGLPMAENLQRRGFRTVGCDVVPAAAELARGRGITVLADARAVFCESNVTVLSLPTQEVLRNVVLGENGLLREAAQGKVIVDTTTATPTLAQELARAVAAAGGAFLDAPVTGGTLGAEKATLSIMLGGESDVIARVHPVLEALGTNIVHIGPSGHGQVAKMVNQMLMAAIYTSVAEGFAFAGQFGADVAKVFAAIENGGARSKLLSDIGPRLIAGTTRDNGNLAQHGKDVDYVMLEANQRKLFLPITAAVHEFYQLSRTLGFGVKSSHDMWTVWEKVLGIDLTETIKRENP